MFRFPGNIDFAHAGAQSLSRRRHPDIGHAGGLPHAFDLRGFLQHA